VHLRLMGLFPSFWTPWSKAALERRRKKQRKRYGSSPPSGTRGYREVLQHAAVRLGSVPVPARAARGRSARWRGASAVYFSRSWTKSRILEDAYGPLEEQEFLAGRPPDDPATLKTRRQLLELLGLRSVPRRLNYSFYSWEQPSLKHFAEWRWLPDTDRAFSCPEGHQQSGRRVALTVMDRLDDLLEQAEQGDGGALARALLLLEDPYGPSGLIRCANSSHRRPRGKPAAGYQRWLLETRAWVPVTQDPAGKASRRPLEAWIEIPQSASWLLVPRAALQARDGRRLGLTSAERPTVEALEAAICELAEQYPDLDQASSEVVSSALWLQERLERALGQSRPNGQRPAIPLAARSAQSWCWSRHPLVPDLPDVNLISTLVALPAGRWTNVGQAYGLRVASQAIRIDIDAVQAPGMPGVLTGPRRAELFALLVKRGGDLRQLGFRLGRLRERPCRTLRLRLSSEAEDRDLEPLFYLDHETDQGGRLSGGVLYFLAGADPSGFALELARSLAEYLGDSRLKSRLASSLSPYLVRCSGPAASPTRTYKRPTRPFASIEG